eukprot:14878020-Alexandrium_andersonii.AAC.1
MSCLGVCPSRPVSVIPSPCGGGRCSPRGSGSARGWGGTAMGCVLSWLQGVACVGVGASWGGLAGGMHGAGECLPLGSPRAEAAAAGRRAGGRSLGSPG